MSLFILPNNPYLRLHQNLGTISWIVVENHVKSSHLGISLPIRVYNDFHHANLKKFPCYSEKSPRSQLGFLLDFLVHEFSCSFYIY